MTKSETFTRKLAAKKRIALIAHDNKKPELIEWAIYNKAVLAQHELYGTGTTGRLLAEALDQPVTRLQSNFIPVDLYTHRGFRSGHLPAYSSRAARETLR